MMHLTKRQQQHPAACSIGSPPPSRQRPYHKQGMRLLLLLCNAPCTHACVQHKPRPACSASRATT